MKFNCFVKKITAKNTGKVFNKYITTLTKTDGTEYYTEVKFSDEANGQINDYGSEFPCVISITNQGGNFTSRKVQGKDKDGNPVVYTRNTLWIKKIDSIEPYIDKSLDEFQ